MSNENEGNCPICMDKPSSPKVLEHCQHTFCTPCITESFEKLQPRCPICGVIYGEIRGTQPDGTMDVTYSDIRLPGYEKYGTIVIDYYFPNGIQTKRHPNPGQPYSGTGRTGYLPNNEEGQKVLGEISKQLALRLICSLDVCTDPGLLRRAFDARLCFTVGRSATTGVDNTTIWNDIHHKTSISGGQHCFGYPDPTYLNRVTQELAAHGIK